MCEFKVLLEGREIMKDAIYARQHEGGIILRDIIGDEMRVEDAEIIEVNVFSTELILRKR
jgi:predicted RNA-binding protein